MTARLLLGICRCVGNGGKGCPNGQEGKKLQLRIKTRPSAPEDRLRQERQPQRCQQPHLFPPNAPTSQPKRGHGRNAKQNPWQATDQIAKSKE